MDDRLTAEILATCDSLGYTDKDKYYKDPSCLGQSIFFVFSPSILRHYRIYLSPLSY